MRGKNIVAKTGMAKLMYNMNACKYVFMLVICDCYRIMISACTCRHGGPIYTTLHDPYMYCTIPENFTKEELIINSRWSAEY